MYESPHVLARYSQNGFRGMTATQFQRKVAVMDTRLRSRPASPKAVTNSLVSIYNKLRLSIIFEI